MLAPTPPLKAPDSHMGVAIMVAILMHVLLILGVSFDVPDLPGASPQQGLDITIIRTRENQEQPEDPALLAQASQQGGAEVVDKTRFTSPASQPTLTPENRAMEARQRSGSEQPQAVVQKEVISSTSADWKTASSKTEAPIKAPVKTDIAQLLASTQQEIVRLSAELDEQARNASNKKRRKAINASTQEFIYATYMHAWRKKVERIGNLNYPDEAKRKKFYGNLMLHVAVRADGTVEGIRVVNTSGNQVLDDAAVRIVKLAAPFAAFPPEIRKQIDVLDITRTWQFRNGNQLFAE